MAISLEEYVTQKGGVYAATEKIGQCSTCHTLLQETIAGYRETDDGAKCSDCYFDLISDLIDEHPVGRPMATRGSAD
jgi:hypothetical protein